jgi:hypothetical protein
MEQKSQYEDNGDGWLYKDRSETTSKRIDRQFGNIVVTNPGIGLNVYKNAFTKEQIQYVIDVLEKNVGSGIYRWNEATVTNSKTPIKKARDCVDFKMSRNSLGPKNEKNAELHDMYELVFDVLKKCVDDYSKYWGINVNWYEVFNFVKYEGEGKEFKIHGDHGPRYVCTVSAVIYLNDDYEGGEIHFPRLDNTIVKPEYGDIAVFPSNYIYEHASLPIKKGTKYCVVVMMDINDLAHKDNPYAVKVNQ